LRILVEGPLNAAFKNVKRTIELCRRANVGEIWLLTSSKIDSMTGVSRVFSQVSISEVPKIYRSCDVLVKLSYVEGMFGPPLEMFHCGGTAIVYDVTGFDEYIKHNINALVAKTNDEESVIRYLHLLHDDRELLSQLNAGANETAKQWINWVQSSTLFANAIEKIYANKSLQDQIPNIQKNVIKYLRERIRVVTKNQQQTNDKEMEALPLYDSGYYVLTIPVSVGETQIGIMFGQAYKRFMITKVRVFNQRGETAAQMNISSMHMNQISDNTFECQAESGMLVFNVNIASEDLNIQADNQLQVEFHPIMIWENQLELVNE
jgi:hypothetical protein